MHLQLAEAVSQAWREVRTRHKAPRPGARGQPAAAVREHMNESGEVSPYLLEWPLPGETLLGIEPITDQEIRDMLLPSRTPNARHWPWGKPLAWALAAYLNQLQWPTVQHPQEPAITYVEILLDFEQATGHCFPVPTRDRTNTWVNINDPDVTVPVELPTWHESALALATAIRALGRLLARPVVLAEHRSTIKSLQLLHGNAPRAPGLSLKPKLLTNNAFIILESLFSTEHRHAVQMGHWQDAPKPTIKQRPSHAVGEPILTLRDCPLLRQARQPTDAVTPEMAAPMPQQRARRHLQYNIADYDVIDGWPRSHTIMRQATGSATATQRYACTACNRHGKQPKLIEIWPCWGDTMTVQEITQLHKRRTLHARWQAEAQQASAQGKHVWPHQPEADVKFLTCTACGIAIATSNRYTPTGRAACTGAASVPPDQVPASAACADGDAPNFRREHDRRQYRTRMGGGNSQS